MKIKNKIPFLFYKYEQIIDYLNYIGFLPNVAIIIDLCLLGPFLVFSLYSDLQKKKNCFVYPTGCANSTLGNKSH